ncbi:MAG TPA: sugar phosphorylase [Clostridia bacterium]|nr:sugar phosphorylase [Clostridia bacterium]
MLEKLSFVYGEDKARWILDEIIKKIEASAAKHQKQDSKSWVDEKDIILITYGDQIREEGRTALSSLKDFVEEHLKGVISTIHILPFYPYSSDDGFSVIDYFKVNPELGNWEEIEGLALQFDLIFDAVINHISVKSEWFAGYLKGKEEYREFFIEADPRADFSMVTRPRTLPLLTSFQGNEGEKHVWTTFSEDQIDINYKNGKVLLRIIDLLLFYLEKGAKAIRLDAIGYLWKESGTSCIHLEQTHKLIQLFRDIFETVSPDTRIITETNVPHKENISYFGNGFNEAHMVYQFPLPPLTLNAFHTGNARHLLEWADTLEASSEKTTFLNFLASHDGIGVMPAKGILSEEEVEAMVEKTREHGGYVSYKNNGDGTKSAYELNINYFDALSSPYEDEELKIKKFICSQGILLCLAGVPGIYAHSLLGSVNYRDGVLNTGINRSINREKLQRVELEKELQNQEHRRSKVFGRYTGLIGKRRAEKAFHPNAGQKVVHGNEHVFSLLRTSRDGRDRVLCLNNVSNESQTFSIDMSKLAAECRGLTDIITGKNHEVRENTLKIELEPYDLMWLKIMVND